MNKYVDLYGLTIFSSTVLQVRLGSNHWDWVSDNNKRTKK